MFTAPQALKARKRIHDVISSKMASGTGLRSWGLLHAIHELSVEGNLDLGVDSITSMALELMLGGQETSASALTSAILALGTLYVRYWSGYFIQEGLGVTLSCRTLIASDVLLCMQYQHTSI